MLIDRLSGHVPAGSRRPGLAVVLAAAGLLAGSPAAAQERRARPPQYPPDAFRGVFFDDVSEAIRGERPRIDALRGSRADSPAGVARSSAPSPPSGTQTRSGTQTSGVSDAAAGTWKSLVEPVHLEDEVKRLKLHYDSLVTTPGQFRSGGFQEARSALSVLAMLMAVISEYDGRVRFQEDAAVARDLLARSARSVTAGSAETFDEAKQRKADLQDLVSGTGLQRSDPAGPTDWSLAGARVPLMQYLEQLHYDTLESGTADAESIEQAKEELDRAAAMVAVVAEVLVQEGMDEAEDADYRQLSEAMQQAAMEVRAALAENDAERASQAVGRLGQSCNACHEQYR